MWIFLTWCLLVLSKCFVCIFFFPLLPQIDVHITPGTHASEEAGRKEHTDSRNNDVSHWSLVTASIILHMRQWSHCMLCNYVFPGIVFVQWTNSWQTKREWQQLWRTHHCWRWSTSAWAPRTPELYSLQSVTAPPPPPHVSDLWVGFSISVHKCRKVWRKQRIFEFWILKKLEISEIFSAVPVLYLWICIVIYSGDYF